MFERCMLRLTKCCLAGGAALLFLPATGCSHRLVVEGDPVVKVLRKDAIHSIDRPRMLSVEEAQGHLLDHEPVLGVAQDGVARAYPLWHLDSHEVVNDTLGDLPIAATW